MYICPQRDKLFNRNLYEIPYSILLHSIHNTHLILIFTYLPTFSDSSFPPSLLIQSLSTSLFSSQDESSALAQTALAAYQYELKKMSLRAVNFLLVNPGKKVNETVFKDDIRHLKQCNNLLKNFLVSFFYFLI